MSHLHRLSEISSRHTDDFQGTYNPVGSTAYIGGGQRIGTVRDVLVDDDQGKIRYLLVDTDGGSTEGAYIVPIGLVRLEDDSVYFDELTSGQLAGLHRYSHDEDYTFDVQSSDERVLRGEASAGDGERVLQGTGVGTASTVADTGTQARYDYRDEDTADRMFKTPERLRLLEERLSVNKERYLAGQVQIGKHVETHTETVNVPVQREEIVIERHAVTDARPVDGDVSLSSGSETVRVELEAERVDVQKQAFVTEEVEIGKRAVTEQQTVTETVGREVLDVNQTGEVRVTGDAALTDDELRRNDK
ncbi:PRC and DUF2382 domain-containing protein [Deinococcus hopiensis]|uniref:Conserved domain-containing protein n=1 Tax=Deinococcus hopiensis KR-140 TaxID=695939 RepID=A0A1W1VRI9_9DEIO|nr:DUF2382 domain-containing protein [Deinococcus hopiensis]SMB95956.1 conserved domain-containing protein [Deinococcus hopiensis KR-140]